jgi:hypothetical protein
MALLHAPTLHRKTRSCAAIHAGATSWIATAFGLAMTDQWRGGRVIAGWSPRRRVWLETCLSP